MTFRNIVLAFGGFLAALGANIGAHMAGDAGKLVYVLGIGILSAIIVGLLTVVLMEGTISDLPSVAIANWLVVVVSYAVDAQLGWLASPAFLIGTWLAVSELVSYVMDNVLAPAKGAHPPVSGANG